MEGHVKRARKFLSRLKSRVSVTQIMKFDLHTHHHRCGHAIGEIEQYIQAAIRAELDMIGISDHSPFFGEDADHPHRGAAMARSEFPMYVAEVLQLKEKYRGTIEVQLGMESDYFVEHAELYRTQYAQYPFDYIIGSIHYLDNMHIFHQKRWEGMSMNEVLQKKESYYRLVQQLAQSGMFDIVGHFDALKGYYPTLSELKTDVVEQTLRIIAQSNIAIEVNTSGKFKQCGGWYPSDDLLERACFYHIPITFGSDAHDPNQIGDDRELVRQKLIEFGYKQWCFFRQRKRLMVDL